MLIICNSYLIHAHTKEVFLLEITVALKRDITYDLQIISTLATECCLLAEKSEGYVPTCFIAALNM